MKRRAKHTVYVVVLSLILSLLLPAGGIPSVRAAKSPKLSAKKLTLYVGGTGTIKVKKASGKVKWSSSKKKVVSISAKGAKCKLKAKKVGKATITAKCRGKKLTCKVTVKKIELNCKQSVMAPGNSLQLKLLGAKGKIKWSSSNQKVAEVANGVVKARAVGTAQITAVYKKKKYTCKIQVIEKQPIVISFDNAQIREQTNAQTGKTEKILETREEKLNISGKISYGSATVTEISYSLYDIESTVVSQGKLNTGNAFSVAVNAPVGTSTFVLTVKNNLGASAQETLILIRYSEKIALSDKVVAGDKESSDRFAETVVDVERQESAIPSETDDLIKITVPRDSDLANLLLSGQLKAGDTYMLPPSGELPAGFTGVVSSWGDPSDPALDGSLYMEVTFEEPKLEDVVDGDGCIDLSGGVNAQDPVAFVMMPDGSQVTSSISNDSALPRAGQDDDTYERKVFPNGMKDLFSPSVSVSSGGKASVKIDFADVLIYDKDGKKSTADQVKLSGSFEFSDITFGGNVQWKEKGFQVIPQQVKVDLSYITKVNVAVKGSMEVDFNDMIEEANEDFKNKIELAGLEISGIDMSDRLMLGIIGLNFVTPPQSYSMGEAVKASGVAPVYFLAVYLDLEGNMSAQLSAAYDYESYTEKGFNFYNADAKNLQYNGAQYSQIKDLSGSYRLGTYETERKARYEYSDPESKMTLEGKAEFQIKSGIGAMGGVMLYGMIPGDFYGECTGEIEASLDGKVEVRKSTTSDSLADASLKLDGSFQSGVALGADLKFCVKNTHKLFEGAKLDIGYSTSKELKLFELKLVFPLFTLEGKTFDLTDKTVNEHPLLPGADIYIYDKDQFKEGETITAELLKTKTPDFEGKSGEDGTYRIKGMGPKEYVLRATAAGYQDYVEEISFEKDNVIKDIYIEPVREKNWLDVCKPYQYSGSLHGEYLGDGNGTMTISGVKYDAGFYLNAGNPASSGTADALWNLEGKYSSLDVYIGHLDDTQLLNSTLDIYLNGSDTPSQTIELNAHDVSRKYTINLDNAESARFALKKGQTNNWATSSFGFVEGVWHGTEGTQGTVNFKDPFAETDWNADFMHICAPYQGICHTLYMGDPEKTFMMSGKTYDTGFVLQTQSIMETWGKSSVMFHTYGKFSALKIRVGRTDGGSYTKNADLYVYVDGEAEPSQTITINASDVAREYTIPLNYAKGVKLSIENVHDNWTTEAFGFADGEWVR